MQKLPPYVCDGRHACRLCKSIEGQQQRQQEQQEALLQAQNEQKTLLQAQKQQYIDFMTEMRQQHPRPDPTCPGQTHTHCANGQSPLPLPWTDGDAHENHQHSPEQLQPLPEQVQQQTAQGRRAQLSRSPTLSEESPPAVQTPSVCNHGVYTRYV